METGEVSLEIRDTSSNHPFAQALASFALLISYFNLTATRFTPVLVVHDIFPVEVQILG